MLTGEENLKPPEDIVSAHRDHLPASDGADVVIPLDAMSEL